MSINKETASQLLLNTFGSHGHGYLCQSSYLLRKEGKYHIADRNGRLYLCGCAKDAFIKNKIKDIIEHS